MIRRPRLPARRLRTPAVGILYVLGLLFAAGSAASPAAAQQDPDFLFKRPVVVLGLRAGYAAPRAGSDVFDFTRERLTVEEDDFRGLAVGGELAGRISERLDLALGVDYQGATAPSEFREWVDQDGLPIEQTTRFVRVPVTLSVKAYLRERGRAVGRFAWVPASWSPFLGAGGGFAWYRFEQRGDFVDYETLGVFTDRLQASGYAPVAHVLAGSDFSLSPRFVLSARGRYLWGSDDMGGDFVGFEEIDLTGFEASVGLSVRF